MESFEAGSVCTCVDELYVYFYCAFSLREKSHKKKRKETNIE